MRVALGRGSTAEWRDEVLLGNCWTSENALELLQEWATEPCGEFGVGGIDEPDARLWVALMSVVLRGVASQRYLPHMLVAVAASADEILARTTSF